MSNNPPESFIRWQSVTREHFTLTSSVVLGLSTGLLAFLSDRFLSSSPPSCFLLFIGVLAVIPLIVSIWLALWCSINRLRDYRATAQIARRRVNKENVPAADRLETKVLGELSWRLFKWQLILFGIGAATSAAALLVRYWF